MSDPILTPPPIAAATVATNELRREFQTLLLSQVRLLARQQLRLKVPATRGSAPENEMAYHFKPELHIQLEGESEFQLAGAETLLLRAGELAIIPALVPHRLLDVTDHREVSRRLVIGFYSSAVSIHFGRGEWRSRPGIDTIGFYPCTRLRQIIDLSEMIIDYAQSTRLHRAQGEQTIAATLLWLLIDLLDDEVPETGTDSNRLFQIKWLVHSHLSNPELSVGFLAGLMRCSPGYLSHLFAKESDEPLVKYINEQRVARAMEGLASNKLSISEIAWACGFADPGYFSRIFRKSTGLTPQNYRRQLEEDARFDAEE